MKPKARACGFIAALFRRPELLEPLVGHPSLLSTLGRVLRDEGKRSVELSTHVVSAFFALSSFSQFHPLILEQQIGALTMDLVDLELKRADHREKVFPT